MKQYEHQPVLASAVINSLNIRPDGIYLDGTFGRGGHSKMILDKLTTGRLVVVDKDPEALQVAMELAAQDPRVTVINSCFGDIGQKLEELGLIGKLNGIFVDIGVSSPQLDNPERGFSFMHDGPLDMRMSRQGQSAQDWLNSAPEQEIARVIRRYGEESFAKRIAQSIIKQREDAPLTRTKFLADLVSDCIPVKVKVKQKKHPATKTFQAIRIHVNQELAVLQDFLQAAPNWLAPTGRLAVLSFHSLEDRAVKSHFQDLTTLDIPRNIPIRDTEVGAPFAWVLKKAVADSSELNINPRARSAKLRVIEKQNKGMLNANATQAFVA